MAPHNQFALLFERRFGPLFVTQFLGAFNDNVFRNALLILIAFQPTTSYFNSNTLINLSAGLFILPFFLFSTTAGQLADHYDKAWLIRQTKLLEIIIMASAVIGFYLNNIFWLMSMLFFMGAQSTLFGPSKYSLLPQHLHPDELIGANGLMETGTFLAILLGTMLGGILISLEHGIGWVSLAVMLLAVLGYVSSWGIPFSPPADPNFRINWNPITETWNNLAFLQRNRTVWLSALGISWFWFVGMMYLTQLPNYTRLNLGSDQQVVTLLLVAFSVGIGAGSLLCEKLSGRRIELGLVPFGSIGITLFGIDLFLATPHNLTVTDHAEFNASQFLSQAQSWRILADIVLIGLFGGFYIVPLYALVQNRSEVAHRSRVIAGNNILNSLLMVASTIVAIILLNSGFTIPQLLLLAALLNAIVAVYIYTLVPEFLMRFIVWIVINVCYRIRLEGLDRIPETGPAILVCNHVSYMDSLIIGGCCRRPVRFVMHYTIYRIPILHFVFKTAGAIPIASAKDDPVLLEQAYQRVADYLDQGEIVCIFPEGRITDDGQLNPFRPGIERIIARNPVPVIPMALQGMWGSFFSRCWGPAMRRWPRRFWSKIALVIGELINPDEVTADLLRDKVLQLRGEYL